MNNNANFKKILRDYNYLYESLIDVKEISSVAEGEFRQAMIDSGDKEALQALIPNESQKTKLNELKEEEHEKEPMHNDVDFKKLFRKIVIKCHPDKNKDASEKQLEFLKECYENATSANNAYDWGLLLRVASQLDVDLSEVDEKQIQNIKLKNEELQKQIEKYESSMAYQWYTKDDQKTRERFLKICLGVFKNSLKPKED
jgi:hypothetical protein